MSGTGTGASGELRLAFLGCGFATRLHSGTLKRFGGVQRLYASRDPARAEAFSRRFGGVGAYGSYDEALRDESVDVALVATPPDSHLPLTLAALQAGKHVIVEKPPFLSSSDFDTIEIAARAAGRQVLVAENYYYKPLAETIRAAIASGDLGEVRFIAVNALKRQRVDDWRGDENMAGGGALFEGGIHWINFMANLGLRVNRVTGYRSGPGSSPERSAVVVLEYEGGAVGTLHHSWEIGSPLKGLRLSAIYGTGGTLTFESNGVFVGMRGRRNRLSAPGLRDLLGYRAMFADFFGAIRTSTPPRFDLSLARRDLELVEAAYRSMSHDR